MSGLLALLLTVSTWYGPVVPNKIADKYIPASYQEIGRAHV